MGPIPEKMLCEAESEGQGGREHFRNLLSSESEESLLERVPFCSVSRLIFSNIVCRDLEIKRVWDPSKTTGNLLLC